MIDPDHPNINTDTESDDSDSDDNKLDDLNNIPQVNVAGAVDDALQNYEEQ